MVYVVLKAGGGEGWQAERGEESEEAYIHDIAACMLCYSSMFVVI